MQGNFTEEDIKFIINEARTNEMFQFYGARVMNVSRLKYNDVVTISSKGLILAKGYSETAYEHIRERHLYWSFNPYPVGNEFQAQSKFPQHIAPVYFIKIADEIYSSENIILNNMHLKSDDFEKYQGNCKFDGINDEITNLILYKGTKIIHSLYPQNKKYNKNKNRTKFPFTRGRVEIRNANSLRTIKEIYIPYFGLELKLKYVIFIEKFYLKDTEEFRILAYDENEKYKFDVIVGEKKLIKFSGETSMKITYQHCDLRQIEDFILEIEKRDKI